jgi:hypothetical protein
MRAKRQEREADRSLPSSAEFQNGGAIPPIPHTSSWCLINYARQQFCLTLTSKKFHIHWLLHFTFVVSTRKNPLFLCHMSVQV